MSSKRRVASVTVFLLAGMVVNVLVAWSALAAADWAKMETTFAGIAGRWPRAAPARWPPPEQLMTKAGLGVVVLSSVTHLQQPPDHSEHYRIDLHALGWPLPAVRCESWMDFSIDGTRGSSTVTHRYDAQPDPSWWTNGAPVPMSRWGFGPQGWKRLPIRPAPAGFAANTALYAALVAGAWYGSAFARRRLRRRRGLCPACGYSLAGINAGLCPECGAGIGPRGDPT